MKTPTLILFLIAITFINNLLAQPGTLDGDFDSDGKVTTDFFFNEDEGLAIAIQPDGKIIVGGGATTTYYNFAIVRYNTDATLDTSFNHTGQLWKDIEAGPDYINAVLLQPDGKIIAAGVASDNLQEDIALARFNSNGTIDNTFGTNGIVITDIGALDHLRGAALQSDGKIVVAGRSENSNGDLDIMVARYNTDGSLDNTFSVDGKVTTAISTDDDDDAHAVTIQPDGKIVVAGSSNGANSDDFALVRYNTDGTLDTSFDTDGKVTTDFSGYDENSNSIVIQPDGKIVVGGDTYSLVAAGDFALARYKTNGSLDNTFNITGKIILDFGYDEFYGYIALQPDGKIVLAGRYYDINGSTGSDFALARFNADGTIDGSFSTDGKVVTDFGYYETPSCVAVQPDGKIIAAGSHDSNITGTHFDFAVARYISGLQLGILDFPSAGNLVVYPNPIRDHEVLEFTLAQDEVIDIGLYDMSGKLIKTFIHHQSISYGKHRESLDFGAALPSGNYVLRLSNGNGSSSIKLARQ